jgi:hypothetical protein
VGPVVEFTQIEGEKLPRQNQTTIPTTMMASSLKSTALLASSRYDAEFADKPNEHEQTIYFVVEFTWSNYEVGYVAFHRFEEMEKAVRQQRNRRVRNDRPISIRYMNVLSRHGVRFYHDTYGTRSAPTLSDLLGVTLEEWMSY